MRIIGDKESRAIYIYMKDKITPGEVARTVSTSGMVNFDMGKNGEILGIELIPTADSVETVVRSMTGRKK